MLTERDFRCKNCEQLEWECERWKRRYELAQQAVADMEEIVREYRRKRIEHTQKPKEDSQ